MPEKRQDQDLLIEGHDALGQTFFCLGEFDQARVHLDRVLLLYAPQYHRTLTLLCGGEDPGIACRGFAAWAQWLCGYPDQALQTSLEAVRLAQEVAHPFSMADALLFIAGLHLFRGETRAARESAEALTDLSTEHGFAFWLAFGKLLQARLDPERTGTALVRGCQAMADYQATGAELFQPYLLGLLAELCGEMRQTARGQSLVNDALESVEKIEERWYEAELYRLKAHLTLDTCPASSSRPDIDVEGCLLKAIEISQHRKVKSLELRAVMTLCRLWRTQDKAQEALRMLNDTYSSFTEGFATRDLQRAKMLLENLH